MADNINVLDAVGATKTLRATDNSGVHIPHHIVDDIVSQPPRTAAADSITAKLATDAIHDGATPLTPKFAVVGASSSGNNELVAAVTGKRIRVLAVAIVGAGTAVGAYFRTSSGGAAIFGSSSSPIPIDKSGAAGPAGLVLPFNPIGWMQTASGEALGLNLSAAQAVTGGLVYVEV